MLTKIKNLQQDIIKDWTDSLPAVICDKDWKIATNSNKTVILTVTKFSPFPKNLWIFLWVFQRRIQANQSMLLLKDEALGFSVSDSWLA